MYTVGEVALRDCQNCRIGEPYRDAQNRLLWRDNCMSLAHHEPQSVKQLLFVLLDSDCLDRQGFGQ